MKIYLYKNDEQFGPYSVEQVQALVDDGTYTPIDSAWFEGCEEWTTISHLPGIVISDEKRPLPLLKVIASFDMFNLIFAIFFSVQASNPIRAALAPNMEAASISQYFIRSLVVSFLLFSFRPAASAAAFLTMMEICPPVSLYCFDK